MRRMMLVVVLAVGVSATGAGLERSAATRSDSGVASVAGGGGSGAVFWTRRVIDRLAVDGARVAAVTGDGAGSCTRIVVWTAPGKKFVVLPTHYYLDCQIPIPVTEVALGAGQVAWIERYDGNGQELVLYGAKASGGPSKKLDDGYITDGSGGRYVGRLFGAGALLAYAKWHVCSSLASGGKPTADCPVEGTVSGETLKWLSSYGRPRLKRGVRSLHLLAVGGGRMAVDSLWPDDPTGANPGARNVDVLSASGALLTTVPAAGNDPPRAVALSANQLVIERRRSLAVHNPATGDLIRTIPLGSAAPLDLVSANTKLALLSGANRLVAIRLSDGKQARVPLPSTPISPRLSETGLFYAYNVATTPAKGRIVFEPTAHLLGRF